MCKISLQGVLTFVLPHTKLEEIESGYKTTCQVYHEIKIQFGTGKESGHCGSTDEGAASQLEPVTVRTAIRKMKTYTECLLDLGHSLDYPASDGSEDELTTYSEPVQINESRGQLPHEPLSSTVLLLTQDEQLRAGSPDYTGRISRDAFEDNPINSLEPYGNVLFTNQGTDIMRGISI
ncbi:hypothetical protein E8E13_001666 [Curvularia kusanoi]|uniref:Uncharacterized protein n=1 Tax=Curvularia kusanoi TaxID=90978 RepID=A0A9P4T3D8_CURKU|nr:hypothetical protein E8E13_001666 [Curvularia kusanoi]